MSFVMMSLVVMSDIMMSFVMMSLVMMSFVMMSLVVMSDIMMSFVMSVTSSVMDMDSDDMDWFDVSNNHMFDDFDMSDLMCDLLHGFLNCSDRFLQSVVDNFCHFVFDSNNFSLFDNLSHLSLFGSQFCGGLFQSVLSLGDGNLVTGFDDFLHLDNSSDHNSLSNNDISNISDHNSLHDDEFLGDDNLLGFGNVFDNFDMDLLLVTSCA
jgi:hypothetical protein